MNLDLLAKRARLQRIEARALDLDRIREMHTGDYTPNPGDFTPPFKPGTARALAYARAVRVTAPSVSLIINKSVAGVDFGNITWSDAERGKDEVDDALNALELDSLARELAIEYKTTGAMVGIASTPLDPAGRALDPTVKILRGVNVPYADPSNPDTITGWYRTVQYIDEQSGNRLRWWVEVYDWEGIEPGAPITHRVWRSLTHPTDLGVSPDDEFTSIARPRFALAGVNLDGLPASPILSNMGRILGLYATELRLATSEELAAFPMLVTKGEADLDSVGPAETIAVAQDGDAYWLDPGDLSQLREQVALKRDMLREVFNLPGGSLGGQTPSGEALQEANRGFIQETRALTNAIEGVLSDLASDYLALLNLPPVTVNVPIDRSYTTDTLLAVVEKGIDLGAVPASVAARAFQQFIGAAYSDDELQAFLAELEARRSVSVPGFLPARDEQGDSV